MATNNNKQKYLCLTGLSYPPDIYAPAGSVVDDIPLSSIRHELEAGHIVEVEVDEAGNVIPPEGQEIAIVFRFYDKDGNEIPNDGVPPEDSGIAHIDELADDVKEELMALAQQEAEAMPDPEAEPEQVQVQTEENATNTEA